MASGRWLTQRMPQARSTYRAKRDFALTSEPRGTEPPAAGGWRFVVQRHRASRLHYDFRLEAAGVLLSWAVPKGPTLDADVKRLAAHVEDHPLDYFDFEGVIPAGEYGGGDVIVWDWGTWALAEGDDPLDAVAAGDLHLALLGEKLRGRFALVRGGGRGRDEWLLIKKHDDDAVAGWNPEHHPRSVKSGRTNDEVRDAPAASWTGSANWAGPTDDELTALDELGTAGRWTLGEHELRLTHLDEVIFPGRGRSKPLTKRDLVRHHATMAPAMLPYLAGRPVDTRQFPNGIDEPGTWRTTRPKRAPSWLGRWRDDGGAEHLVPDSAAALAWLANDGAVELHPWTAGVDAPDRPTWVCIDVGPGRDVLDRARLHRAALEHLGVEGRPVADGTGGIQIWVPISPRSTFERVRRWRDALSQAIDQTLGTDVGDDGGGHGADDHRHLAPFSPRAAPGAPVAVPLAWDELDDPEVRLDRWTIRDIGARLAATGDPLAPLIGRQQQLPAL